MTRLTGRSPVYQLQFICQYRAQQGWHNELCNPLVANIYVTPWLHKFFLNYLLFRQLYNSDLLNGQPFLGKVRKFVIIEMNSGKNNGAISSFSCTTTIY